MLMLMFNFLSGAVPHPEQLPATGLQQVSTLLQGTTLRSQDSPVKNKPVPQAARPNTLIIRFMYL